MYVCTFAYSSAQALLVEARQFLLEVYRDFTIVWPALLMYVTHSVLYKGRTFSIVSCKYGST